MRRFVCAISVALAFVAFWLGSTGAAAHAVLVRATPSINQTLSQSPDQVQLLFSEPLDPVFSSIAVVDATRTRVDAGDSHVDPANDRLLVVTVMPALPNGVYVVFWRSLSAIDVHPDVGAYRLFVGVPATASSSATASLSTESTATPETTLGRWWFYIAASLFGGVLATWKLVVSRAWSEARPYELHARTRQLITAGGVLLIAGTLFMAVAQAAAAANVSLLDAIGKPLTDLLLRGRFASIWWPRVGLEVAGLLLIVFGGIDGLAAECALATLPAVLLTSALTSHGAALDTAPGYGILIDWLHIVGATAWVGGLIGVLAWFAVLQPSRPLAEHLLGRFGRFALAASGLVLISGALQGVLEVGAWDALLTTAYGQLVLAKVGLLVAMLIVASTNEVRARISHAPPRGIGQGVTLEVGLGVVVFLVAAVLSGTPPSPR